MNNRIKDALKTFGYMIYWSIVNLVFAFVVKEQVKAVVLGEKYYKGLADECEKADESAEEK